MRFIAAFSGCWPLRLQPAQRGVFAESATSLEQQLRSLVGCAVQRCRRRRARPDDAARPSASTAIRPFRWRARSRSRSPRRISAQVDHGRRSLDDRIARPVLRPACMERMMIHSDNQATDMLIRDLGGPERDPGLGEVPRTSAISGWIGTIARLLADKRDLWDYARLQHAAGDGRPAPPPRQGQRAEAGEPLLS